MKNRFAIIAISSCVLFAWSCQEEAKELQTVKTSRYDDFVRNPVTYGAEIDSSIAAQITFDEKVFDFGEAEEGELIAHTFTFRNTGKSPLVISEARSTCGCTVPKWPKTPVEIGGEGEISVEFNTKNRPGFQDKPITVYANTLPGRTLIRIKGTVNKNQNN